MNEVTIPVIYTALALTRLIKQPDAVDKATVRSAKALVSCIGGMTVDSIKSYWDEIRLKLEDKINNMDGTPPETLASKVAK